MGPRCPSCERWRRTRALRPPASCDNYPGTGGAPQQACFDGAFSSRANFEELKRLEVNDVVFTKAKGISVDEMAGDRATFRTLRNFRAGIEVTISFLKRCVGWTRCAWRSLRSFHAYAWASVVTANRLLLARRQPN
jgi:IS5 family transposase